MSNSTVFREAQQDFTDWDCEETVATGRKIMTAVYIGAAILTFEVFVTLGFGVRKIIYNREKILTSLGQIVEKLKCNNREDQNTAVERDGAVVVEIEL